MTASKTGNIDQLWTKTSVMEHDIHRLKTDVNEIGQGVKALLQRDASRPEPVKMLHTIATVASVLGVVGVLTGFVQWQINASTTHIAMESRLQITELRLEIAKQRTNRRVAYLSTWPKQYGKK